MATTSVSSGATEEQFQALSKYTACDIADALLKLKVPNAGFLPDLQLFAPHPSEIKAEITIAPASTVIFASKSGANTSDLPEANIPPGKHWVDLTQPETIVVMRQQQGQKCAVLGGIMALRMKVLNAKGVVVNGRVRDLAELRDTGLPIWAKSTSTVGTGLEAKPHAVQVALDIDGTIVEPGDLVFSDATNGVVIIPQSKVTKVIEMLPGLVGADDRVKEDVAQGVTVQEAFKKHRET
ncbi:RraA-like protein [Hyaloscypha variabilis]|uniref:RraA-like protein n=1 Tax=Hyaloscypha variabilis (strain UAMH 11265 / GT02V1 / F) TaxID=1149755 RepID=A0A2J6S643_HYAVF|nr:RraA-like protein [Hyaloscypha variabilis F]